MNIGPLDRRICIEKKVVTRDPDYNTEVITWAVLATVWANVQDEMPSRSETTKEDLIVASRRARIRFRYRSDVTSAMRVTIRGAIDRVLQIIGGPAEIGERHTYTEIMCEEYSS
jgi:SPP1 family predicted phage head-tail adaptor